MTVYGSKELAASFRTVRKNTLLIAEDIPESKYGYRPTPETRSVGELLAHIAAATSLQERIQGEQRTTLAGLDFMAIITQMQAVEKASRTKAEVIELLRKDGERFASFLEGLTDEFLGQRVSMPPGMTPDSKSRFEMLLGPKEHEMHHRGQLMLIERMLGIVPHLTREMQAGMASMATAKASV